MAKALDERRYGLTGIDEKRAMRSLGFVQGLVSSSLPANTMVWPPDSVITADPDRHHRNSEGIVHGDLAAVAKYRHAFTSYRDRSLLDPLDVMACEKHIALSALGFSTSEAIGKPLDIIIPKSLRKRHWAGYANTARTGKTGYDTADVLAVPALRKDGVRISIEFTILPFQDQAGRVLGIAATLRDVTRQFDEMKALRKEAAARRTTPG